MKGHLFVHQSSFEEHKSLKKAYAKVVPALEDNFASLFFDGPIGFSILAPSFVAARRVADAFGWKTLRVAQPGVYVTDDDIW